jgi:indole-3-glycerol phosphate synthase
VVYKRQELEQRKRAAPLSELKARATERRPPLDFGTALRGRGVRLIAEVKKASPSKGLLRPDLNPVQIAETYASNGAAAISVLTDEKFFQGDLEFLQCIRSQLSNSQRLKFDPRDASVPVQVQPIPILRKDFIFDPYQVYETGAFGADALLLIVAILSDGELSELLGLTRALGMTALVEVHDETEVERALRSNPRVLGINNRNLYDFGVDLDTFGRLRPLIPPNIVVVAESGVRTAADVRRIGSKGADAVLVGEALVTAANVSRKVRELVEAGNQRTMIEGR